MKPLSEIINNVHNAATPEGGGRRLVRTTSCPSAISQLSSDLPFNPRAERPKTAIDPPPSTNYIQSLPMPKEQTTSIEPPVSSDLPLKPEDGEEPCRIRKRSCSEDEEQQGVEKENVGRPQKRAKDVAVEVKPKQRSVASANTANDPPPVPVDKSEATAKTNTTKRSESRKRPAGETTTTRLVKKSSKQQSSAIQTWKRNAINGRHRNLLSSFVTYEDQLPPTPTTTSYERVSMQSPSSRGGDRQSLSRCSSTDDGLLDLNEGDGVPMCTLDSDTVVRSRLSSQLKSKTTRSNYSKLTIVLRSFFVICSSLSFTCRCLIWFGGKSSESIEAIIHNMIEYSSVWILRLYVSLFHISLILIELRWTLPIVLPPDTLSVLTQRGFVQSFLATLDLVLMSNTTMAEAISIVSGALLTARERRVHISHAIMSVTSRGMMFVGAVYFFLGLLYDDCGGKKNKRAV